METRANYVLIGLFTLAVIAAAFGFIYWFQSLGGHVERSYYRVIFNGSVGGLRTGGSVLFNGLRVGEVAQLRLDPEKPDQVTALIAVDKGVAIREDTRIGIEFQGLTGIAAIGLTGGTPSKPPIVGTKENPGLIPGERTLTQDLTSGAREVLQRLDQFIVDNQQSFANSMKNIETFTSALSRNSQKIDNIVTGLEGLTGGPDGKSGEINETAKSLHKLSDNLDRRTEEITVGITKFTTTATKQFETVGASARSTLQAFERTAKQIGDNPSSLLFGGKK
ncbi:MAG: MCE family protein [Pseudolabrys sp.]|nr:MCE family protein [Pseudolabrys sp.]MBV9260507.1 MCE family protein [Pseudolabrys sp.]